MENKKKLVSIMAVWDEQNMIALSIESTKDIVYEYIIIIKKGIDNTRTVVEYCKNKWNLNVRIIESELKLRYARAKAVEISKDYADYYLIQDGDEIYFTTDELKNMGQKTIIELMDEEYALYSTSMIYLKQDLLHTTSDTWLVPHPFLVKNVEGLYWPNEGDMPDIKDLFKYKHSTTGEKQCPYKFDCNIKNFRRIFLRSMFTPWHDGNNQCTIEEYNYLHNPHCIYYKQHINNNSSLDEIINFFENEHKKDSHKWCIKYDENEYYPYTLVIKKYINRNMIRGIENIADISNIQ